jgi:hypothetical protein
MWDRRTPLMVDPPVKKGFIWDDVEALFGRRGLSESIRNISAKIGRFSTAAMA